jgi:predicted nucleic acid-binding protein
VIVVDASVVVDTVVGPGLGGERLAATDLAAPHLVDAEVGSAVRRQLLSGALDAARAGRAIDRLRRLELVRYGHGVLLARAWDLHPNLTFYDALYVALAEALGAPLVTLDARLAGAPGVRATIELLPSA